MAQNKEIRLTEAEPIVEQNVPEVEAIPATEQEIATVAPVEETPVVAEPSEVPSIEEGTIVEPEGSLPSEPSLDSAVPGDEAGYVPVGGEEIIDSEEIKVNPETVTVEVQVPTDQLAAAVAQATGDVEMAEVSPEMEQIKAEQSSEIASPAPEEAEEPLVEEPLEASEDVGLEPATDSEIEPVEEAPAVEDIPAGLSEARDVHSNPGYKVAQEMEDRTNEIIEKGVENMAKSLTESEEDTDADSEEAVVEDDIEDIDLPIAFKDGEFDDFEGESPEGLFDDIEVDDFEVANFLSKLDNFFDDSAEPSEVADALRTSADFMDAVFADNDDEEESAEEDVIEDAEPSEEKETFSFKDILDGVYDEDEISEEDAVEDDEDIDAVEESLTVKRASFLKESIDSDDEIYIIWGANNRGERRGKPLAEFESLDRAIDYAENILGSKCVITERNWDEGHWNDIEVWSSMDDEAIEESLVRVPCKFPKKKDAIRESEELDMSGIVYPAGSPIDIEEEVSVYSDEDIVKAHEHVVESRRQAIRELHKARDARQASNVSRKKFAEALRSTVSVTEESSNPNSWSNNRFIDKYAESQKFSFKDLLDNGYLG